MVATRVLCKYINIACTDMQGYVNNMDALVCIDGNAKCSHNHGKCACAESCPTSETDALERENGESFVFAGQVGDGDVPKHEGESLLVDENAEELNGECTFDCEDIEGSKIEAEGVRFVNGFQFAAAQQIRTGNIQVSDSDSEDRDSVLSNLEISSNLSALSDLSHSSESLNSMSSFGTGSGGISIGVWSARPGSNADGDSMSSSATERSRLWNHTNAHQQYGAQNHDGTCRTNENLFDFARKSWSKKRAARTRRFGTGEHDGTVYSNSANLNLDGKGSHIDKCSTESYQHRLCHRDAASSTRQCALDQSSDGQAQLACIGDGEHRRSSSVALGLKVTGSGKPTIVKKCDKTLWADEVKRDSRLVEGVTNEKDVRIVTLGKKRKSRVIMETPDPELHLNGKSTTNTCKKVICKSEGEKFTLGDKSPWPCDENGNYTGEHVISLVAQCKTNSNRRSKTKDGVTQVHRKKKKRERNDSKKKIGGDPKKVEELKRKLEAISSELARLQREKSGKKTSAKRSAHKNGNRKTKRLKGTKMKGGKRAKRAKSNGLPVPKNATFKLLDFFLLPPNLVLGDGDLRPSCSMVVPHGIRPPKCHPVWHWKLGGSPLPKTMCHPKHP